MELWETYLVTIHLRHHHRHSPWFGQPFRRSAVAELMLWFVLECDRFHCCRCHHRQYYYYRLVYHHLRCHRCMLLYLMSPAQKRSFVVHTANYSSRISRMVYYMMLYMKRLNTRCCKASKTIKQSGHLDDIQPVPNGQNMRWIVCVCVRLCVPYLRVCCSADVTVSVSSPLHTMMSAFVSSIRMVLLFDCSWFMVDVVIGVAVLKKYCVVVCGLFDVPKLSFIESASMLSMWLFVFVMTLLLPAPTILTLFTVVVAAVLKLTLLSTTIVEFGWILWSSCIVFLILGNGVGVGRITVLTRI